MKEVLSQEVGRGLKDPRVGFVTVTGVDATADLRHAKVYVSVLGKGVQKEATLAGLRSAHGYLQGVIAQELRLKRTPTLEFLYDQSIDEGMKIQAMLNKQAPDASSEAPEAPLDGPEGASAAAGDAGDEGS